MWMKKGYLKPVSPTVADVVYSLMMDASEVDQSFKNWCSDFGYSDDSIKALNTYRQCQETRDALMVMFGSKVFEQIQEACQDY